MNIAAQEPLVAKPDNGLDALIDKTFIKERFGQKTVVILREVKKRKVLLQYPDRADRFTLPIEEFQKYFRRP